MLSFVFLSRFYNSLPEAEMLVVFSVKLKLELLYASIRVVATSAVCGTEVALLNTSSESTSIEPFLQDIRGNNSCYCHT